MVLWYCHLRRSVTQNYPQAYSRRQRKIPLFFCWRGKTLSAVRSPPLSTAAGEAGMVLSIEMGKLRHGGWRSLSVGTGSSPCHRLPPCLAWPQVEIFIKPIREQKEFSKRRSYVTSPRPPWTSPLIIGLGWGGALRGGAGGGHHCHGHPKGLHPPLPHCRESPGPGTSLCHPVEPHP